MEQSEPTVDTDALVLQALALRSIGRMDTAINICWKAMAASEERADIVMLTHDMINVRDGEEGALAFLEQSVAKQPDNHTLIVALGTSLSRTPRRVDALRLFQRALVQDPSDFNTAFRAARLALEQNEAGLATAIIEQNANARSEPQPILIQGAVLCAELNHPQIAEHLLLSAEALAPFSGNHRHIAASVRGESKGPLSAADVAAQFDHHAETFDENLTALGYQGPEMILQALSAAGLDQKRGLDVLDAGCGTGLCGPILRPLAKTLTGIDLSPEMIRHAEARGCYDATAIQDIRTLAETHSASFDLVVSADVLGYFGDLIEPLASFRACLRPGGHALLTVEALEDQQGTSGYNLRPSGRYCHSIEYVRATLLNVGFSVRTPAIHGTLRREYDNPVRGMVVLGISI